MVLVLPGSFAMGSPQDEYPRGADESEHQRNIRRAFWLAETELTNAVWNKVMGKPTSIAGPADHPAAGLSWDDCQEFLAKFNVEGGAFRLPSEAEWEYACRAGKRTTFATGARLPFDKACFNSSRSFGDQPGDGKSPQSTVAVGSFEPNAFGLYDMHGNVAEWCEDTYNDYPDKGTEEPKRDDKDLTKVDTKVFRGGSWACSRKDCRAAARSKEFRGYQDEKLGFRLAHSF
jgi:formylglycine-generating enzyme required for sulfatase activity